jgi:sugar-specific transcriptional regulator TrmB
MYVLNGNSEEITKMFKPFGLTEYESRVYFALQVCGKTKICQLWIKAGVPQSKIYQILPELAIRGLVEIIPKQPKEARAKPFLRFANDFLTTRKCLLEEIDEKIQENREAMKDKEKFVRVVV